MCYKVAFLIGNWFLFPINNPIESFLRFCNIKYLSRKQVIRENKYSLNI